MLLAEGHVTFLTFTQQESAELGEILLSLSYLPTAERLTVVVMKAKDLRVPITTPSSGEIRCQLFFCFFLFVKKKSLAIYGDLNRLQSNIIFIENVRSQQ